MQTLDLYKGRKHTVVKIGDSEFKIPNEYTVEEVERLFELREQQEALEEQQASETEAGREKQHQRFMQLIFDQLEIIFQHHQPDMTAEWLKKHVTQNEALEIIGFFDKYRRSAFKQLREEEAGSGDAKKKLS